MKYFSPGQIFYNPNGSIKEIDFKYYSADGQVVEIDKTIYANMNKEIDLFSKGTLSSVQTYDPYGRLLGVTKYAADGVTVSEADQYSYANNSLQPDSLKKYDGSGKLFETDTFSYGNFGFVSQITKADGSGKVFETDNYNLFGHLVSTQVPAPQTTTPATQPTSNWSSTSGFGECDITKALGLELGKAIKDVTPATYVQKQWDLTSMHFEDAWASGYTGKGVVVADIDTGLDLKNAELTKNISQYSWNFVSGNSNVQDDNGHGTCTASEIIASNDGHAVTGGAYDSQLMVLKALDSKGSGTVANVVSAINYAVSHGANVINLSLGNLTPDSTLKDALSNANSHGVIVCMSAGNEANPSPTYPASYAQTLTDCIAVGACKQTANGTTLASFSDMAGSSTPYNFVDAPGVGIIGYGLDGKVLSWDGTSMAAPLVAAEAAVMLSAHSSLTTDQIVQDIVHGTIQLVGVSNM